MKRKLSIGKLGVTLLLFTCLVGCGSNSAEQQEKLDSNLDSVPELSQITTYAFPQGFHKKLNQDNCNWDAQKGVATIKKDVIFGGDNDIQGFYWEVPTVVKKVYIKANVKVTGGFRTKHALTIEGENRKNSAIFGTNTKQWKKGHVNDEWNYTALSASNGGALTIKSLTIQNSRTYNVNSYDSTIIVDNCSIINTRGANDENSNNDGFGGGPGSEIRNSYLAVNDDVIKIYEKNMKVTNVTIKLQSKNSVAFQMGWDNSPDAQASATFKNVLVNGAAPDAVGGKPGYNQGIFAWKGGSASQTRTVTFDGFKVTGLNNSMMYDSTKGKWVDMALVSLWRSNGTLVLKGDDVYMSAPTGSYPHGTIKIQFSGLNTTTVKNSYDTGKGKNVNGDGYNLEESI